MALMPWSLRGIFLECAGLYGRYPLTSSQVRLKSCSAEQMITWRRDVLVMLRELHCFTIPLVLFSWWCADLFKCNHVKHTCYIFMYPCASVLGFTGQKWSQSIVWMWEMGDAVRGTSGTWHSLALSHTFFSTNLFYHQLPRDWHVPCMREEGRKATLSLHTAWDGERVIVYSRWEKITSWLYVA